MKDFPEIKGMRFISPTEIALGACLTPSQASKALCSLLGVLRPGRAVTIAVNGTPVAKVSFDKHDTPFVSIVRAEQDRFALPWRSYAEPQE